MARESNRQLPAINLDSETWVEVKRYLDAKLRIELSKLRNKDTSHDNTQFCRGVIAALEDILSLEDKILEANSEAF